ncbi:MAG: hypothetical protein AB7S99_06510 [Pseudodonghicola sp.]
MSRLKNEGTLIRSGDRCAIDGYRAHRSHRRYVTRFTCGRVDLPTSFFPFDIKVSQSPEDQHQHVLGNRELCDLIAGDDLDHSITGVIGQMKLQAIDAWHTSIHQTSLLQLRCERLAYWTIAWLFCSRKCGDTA